MKVGVYFEQDIQAYIYCDQTDELQQIFANIMISNVYI